MNITEAMHVMDASVRVPGHSDQQLIDRVRAHPKFHAPRKTLTVAAGLESGVTLRPVDALHQLARATRPMVQQEVFDQYVQWAMLRYLGFFDLSPRLGRGRRLKVSDAGTRIVGNQRRVTSEDMGIGFGVLLARRWFARAQTFNTAISVVDIDVALRTGFTVAGRGRRAVRGVAKNRPDYLLISNAGGRRYMLRVLECKGSKSKSGAREQLVKAVIQLEGVTVSGRVPIGLAVSTITADEEVSYLAIDPDDAGSPDEEPTYLVTGRSIQNASDFLLSDAAIDVPIAVLASAALSASWAQLAEFSGNQVAAQRWSTAAMKLRADRLQPIRTELETRYGTARGVQTPFLLNGRQLSVFYGIDADLDDRLSDPRATAAEATMEAQAEFADRVGHLSPNNQMGRFEDAPYGLTSEDAHLVGQEGPVDQVDSVNTDGSIFSLILD